MLVPAGSTTFGVAVGKNSLVPLESDCLHHNAFERPPPRCTVVVARNVFLTFLAVARVFVDSMQRSSATRHNTKSRPPAQERIQQRTTVCIECEHGTHNKRDRLRSEAWTRNGVCRVTGNCAAAAMTK